MLCLKPLCFIRSTELSNSQRTKSKKILSHCFLLLPPAALHGRTVSTRASPPHKPEDIGCPSDGLDPWWNWSCLTGACPAIWAVPPEDVCWSSAGLGPWWNWPHAQPSGYSQRSLGSSDGTGRQARTQAGRWQPGRRARRPPLPLRWLLRHQRRLHRRSILP